ncbi:MAG: sulfotransferase domain-containing protein [Candidatus Hydrogenedentota bacterium]
MSLKKKIARRLTGKRSPGQGATKVDRQLAFVISAPRSGSTWLKRALNQHPGIYCTEQRLFGQYYDVVPNADATYTLRLTLDEYAKALSGFYDYDALGLSLLEYRDDFIHHMVQAMLEYGYTRSGKPVLVDKITPYRHTSETVLRHIKRYTPQAHLIQLVRDGRDVITSGVFDWIARTKRDHPRYEVFVKKEADITLERFFDDDDLTQWADEWAGPIRAFQNAGGAPITIRYEAMKMDQAGTLRQVFDYLQLPADSAIVARCVEESSFKKMSAGREAGQSVSTAKARKGIAGDWKNYFTRQDGARFHECAGDCLIAMGYVTDASWVDELPESLALTAAHA